MHDRNNLNRVAGDAAYDGIVESTQEPPTERPAESLAAFRIVGNEADETIAR
jgi:hypothetical protein